MDHFVNADVIARGLSGFDPASAALMAGRILLARLDALAVAEATFAFETTLASRTLIPRIRSWRLRGYRVQLVFLSPASPDVAVQRVADRVRTGGHFVPTTIVRRKFARGLGNLFRLYIPRVTGFQVLDNSGASGPKLLARGENGAVSRVHRPVQWRRLQEYCDRESD